MPTVAEALRALQGAVALARRDPDASRFFDLSADAFWRSFGAIVFIVPLYIIFVMADARMTAELAPPPAPPMPSMPSLFAAEIVALGLDWVAYPLVMFFVTRQFDLTRRYAAYIIVYNWSSLLVALVLTPPSLLYAVGLLPVGLIVLINLLAVIALLVYHWYIATQVLAVPGVTAAGFVALDVLLDLFIFLGVSSLMPAPDVPL